MNTSPRPDLMPRCKTCYGLIQRLLVPTPPDASGMKWISHMVGYYSEFQAVVTPTMRLFMNLVYMDPS